MEDPEVPGRPVAARGVGVGVDRKPAEDAALPLDKKSGAALPAFQDEGVALHAVGALKKEARVRPSPTASAPNMVGPGSLSFSSTSFL